MQEEVLQMQVGLAEKDPNQKIDKGILQFLSLKEASRTNCSSIEDLKPLIHQ